MSTQSKRRSASRHRPMPGALGQQLRRLAGWAVASSLTAAIGCSNEPQPDSHQPVAGGSGFEPVPPLATEGVMDTSGPEWRRMSCGPLLLPTDPIQAARPLDYFAVVATTIFNTVNVVSDYGDPCSGASDRSACELQLQELMQLPGACSPPQPCFGFSVFTDGDVVKRLNDVTALPAVLGPIDTYSEATVSAIMQGLTLACTGEISRRDLVTGTSVREIAGGYRVYSAWDDCGQTQGIQTIDVNRDGTTSQLLSFGFGRSGCVIGRRPGGLELAELPHACQPLGAYLANCAQLEAASVHAFERMQRELRQLGAAGSLLSAARRSAREERRHTQLTAALARRYGGAAPAPQVSAPVSSRGALEIALENAGEGCVRETFGAMLAWHQAALARDPHVAAAMREIAADETRHAELSWNIAEWLEPQLSAGERALVAAARGQALRQLAGEIDREALPDDARQQIGLPSAAMQHTMLERMAAELQLS